MANPWSHPAGGWHHELADSQNEEKKALTNIGASIWGIHLTGAGLVAAAGVHPFSMAGSPPGGPGSADDPSPG